jgi:hypothetical protein
MTKRKTGIISKGQIVGSIPRQGVSFKVFSHNNAFVCVLICIVIINLSQIYEKSNSKECM